MKATEWVKNNLDQNEKDIDLHTISFNNNCEINREHRSWRPEEWLAYAFEMQLLKPSSLKIDKLSRQIAAMYNLDQARSLEIVSKFWKTYSIRF